MRVLDSRPGAGSDAHAHAHAQAAGEEVGTNKDGGVLLKGHVGDVLDVKFFPSGEVRLHFPSSAKGCNTTRR